MCSDEDAEFEIVTSDQRRLAFVAASVEDRDEWVQAIESLIAKTLGSQSALSRSGRPLATRSDLDRLLLVAGNEVCADCGDRNPSWAAINLGVFICIACSGVHRKMGTHVSKVRSLDLDQWPVHYLWIMEKIGNAKANDVFEKELLGNKPTPMANA